MRAQKTSVSRFARSSLIALAIVTGSWPVWQRLKRRMKKKAAALLETALKVSDEPITRMNLALIYTQLGNIDGAIHNYDLVSKADPNNLDARHHLITLLCEKNDFQAAQTALIELTDKERSVENYVLLANLDSKLNNYAGAVRALEDALDLGDKPELLKQLEGVLLDWSQKLLKDGKREESASVKGARRASCRAAFAAYRQD